MKAQFEEELVLKEEEIAKLKQRLEDLQRRDESPLARSALRPEQRTEQRRDESPLSRSAVLPEQRTEQSQLDLQKKDEQIARSVEQIALLKEQITR